jgi:Putative adhesin
MKDLQREILSQVAAGKITAEEGAARLESLESAQTPPPAAPASAPVATQAGAQSARRIKVISQIGSAEIVGDPSVAYVVADGPHTARQEGDTMVICQAPFEEKDHFQFSHSERRLTVNGIDFHKRKLTVRMNPKLALFASVQAGSVRIEGVQGPIAGEVQAGNCQVSGFRGPLDFVIQMGNLSASGQLDSGDSKVRCEMGSVKIHLEKGSSVRVTARTTLGKVSIEGEGSDGVVVGQTSKDATIGSGAGSLDIECTMGNVRVSAD